MCVAVDLLSFGEHWMLRSQKASLLSSKCIRFYCTSLRQRGAIGVALM